MPRRPFIAVPRYIFFQSSPIWNGSAPISISLMHRPIVWVPGASMQVLAIHGLASHSPTPTTPPSVRMTMTKLSCAEEVKLAS